MVVLALDDLFPHAVRSSLSRTDDEESYPKHHMVKSLFYRALPGYIILSLTIIPDMRRLSKDVDVNDIYLAV